jgi:hypothetical protein
MFLKAREIVRFRAFFFFCGVRRFVDDLAGFAGESGAFVDGRLNRSGLVWVNENYLCCATFP